MTEIIRKLASVQQIEELKPIPDADNIETARILGWDVVVKKGEFRPGDLCVFFEIDSFLPFDDRRYAFLHKNAIKWRGLEGMRVRTVRLRKQISQGLALPLSDFPELLSLDEAPIIGLDLTEMLNIVKWEPNLSQSMGGVSRSTFPSHLIPKTDQERIQNLYKYIIGDHAGVSYEVTQKLDGASMTVYMLEDDILRVCSRNHDLVETDENIFWRCAHLNRLDEKLKAIKKTMGYSAIAVQGELMGPGVQGNPENLPSLRFFVFDMFDIEAREYLSPALRQTLALEVGLDHAPILHEALEFPFLTIDEAIKHADGVSELSSSMREGLVFKSRAGNFSFKIISNEYLLAEK